MGNSKNPESVSESYDRPNKPEQGPRGGRDPSDAGLGYVKEGFGLGGADKVRGTYGTESLTSAAKSDKTSLKGKDMPTCPDGC